MFAVAAASLFFTAACVKTEQNESFTLNLDLGEGVSVSSVKADLCYGDGLSFGNVRLKEGKNSIPKSFAPCYVVCDLPEGYDCPVIFLDETESVSMAVSAAEKGEDGEFLYTYSAFLRNYAEDKQFGFQMCLDTLCYPAQFRNGVARLSLAYDKYDLKVFDESGVIMQESVEFGASGRRFSVFDLAAE